MRGGRKVASASARQMADDSWTTNLFDACSLVLGDPYFARACALDVVGSIGQALQSGSDPSVRGLVRLTVAARALTRVWW